MSTKRPVPPSRGKKNRDLAFCGRFPKIPLPSNPLLAVDLETATEGYPVDPGSVAIFPQRTGEQPPCEVTLCQEQVTVVPGVLYQTPAGFHQIA